MTDELSKLFESTKRLYRTEADEAINRLLLILNSSLLDDRIISSIDPVLKRLMEVSNDIGSIEDKNFKGIHELERKIRVEEKTLELLENSISTFISHRSLSTTLSILFESLYYEITKEELPFLVVSRESEALQTYPTLRSEENELLVGVIGIPLFSVSHTHEWILAGHEFGHIIANKELGIEIEYNYSYKNSGIINNYMMEILADFTAMQIFGPVFLEVLLTEFTGAERASASPTHPPIPWRIRLCYDQASYFNRKGFNEEFKEKGVEKFIDAIEGVIGELYPKEESERIKGFGEMVEYKDVESKIREIKEKDFEKIRNIADLKNCYKNAYKFSELLRSDTIPQYEMNSYSPEQIVIGGYLASREKPEKFKSYTQNVVDSLIRMKI